MHQFILFDSHITLYNLSSRLCCVFFLKRNFQRERCYVSLEERTKEYCSTVVSLALLVESSEAFLLRSLSNLTFSSIAYFAFQVISGIEIKVIPMLLADEGSSNTGVLKILVIACTWGVSILNNSMISPMIRSSMVDKVLA